MDLFGIPARQHHGPFRPMAGPGQFAQHPGGLEECCRSAGRIDPAVDPGVAMVAQHDALLRLRAAPDAPRDHPDRAHRVVHPNLDPHLRRPRTHVVGQGQPTLPGVWRHRPAEGLEQRLGIPPGHRHRDDSRNRSRLTAVDTPRAFDRRPSRSQRVTRNDEVVGDRAPLDMALGTPRPLRKDLALAVAVLSRVRIDDQCRDAPALGFPGLESPVAVGHRVAHQRDLAPRVDPLALQPVVVLRIAAVGVDQISGQVTGRRHPEVGGADVRCPGVLVHRDAVLAQRGFVAHRLDHLHLDLLRKRQKNLVLMQPDVFEPVLDESITGVFGELEVSRRARFMRLLRQEAKVTGDAGGVEQR